MVDSQSFAWLLVEEDLLYARHCDGAGDKGEQATSHPLPRPVLSEVAMVTERKQGPARGS